jgi:tRNA threonylcarbamoyladenosine biosynthesis protein TsaB
MESLRILVIDTSTRYGGVAVARGDGILAERLSVSERTIAARLPTLVQEVLADAGMTMAELQGVGVVVGPGSFTGVRVGVACAKGIAYALGIPVAPCSSLELLAMNFPHAGHPVCVMLDARKGEVYAACYEVGTLPQLLTQEAAIAPEMLIATVKVPTIFAGEGALVYRGLLESSLGDLAIIADPVFSVPRPAHAIPLVSGLFRSGRGQGAEALLPVYLRQSEAEIARRRGAEKGRDSG